MLASILVSLVLVSLQAPPVRDTGVRTAPDGAAPVDGPLVGRRDPDVLVIIGDDFNWVDLASVETPNIDALASNGMTFRNGYVFPLCSITRYSVVFGRYPRRDGIGTLVAPAPPGPDNPTPTLGLPTLPTVVRLTPRGPFKSVLVGKWHLGTNSEYDGNPAPDIGPVDIGALTPQLHGFDHFLAGTMANLHEGNTDGGDYYSWDRVDDGVYSYCTEFAPQAQLDSFRTWWPGPHRRMAILASNLVHMPLDIPPRDWLPPKYPKPMFARDRYEAMLLAFDMLVGRILDEVDLEHTYVFVLTDNGTPPRLSTTPCPSYATFEGCTKSTVWQGGINVPFFVAGPGIPPGSTTDAPVSSTDLMATISELIGVSSPGEDSISFAPVLFDPSERTRRIVFSETFGTFIHPDGGTYYREESAAIGERYKLRRLDGEEFLFDLREDPGETQRLDLGHPPLAHAAEDLRAVLDDPFDRTLQEY